jgi:hypothetical protein
MRDIENHELSPFHHIFNIHFKFEFHSQRKNKMVDYCFQSSKVNDISFIWTALGNNAK